MAEYVTENFFEGLKQLNLSLNDQQLAQFLHYQQELLDWNTRFNLTAITEPEEVQIKHFLDSLSLLVAYDKPQTHLLDIGSGAPDHDNHSRSTLTHTHASHHSQRRAP